MVINKNDLVNKLNIKELGNHEIVYTNTIDLKGIDSLKEKITKMFNLEKIKKSDYNYITNIRQISKIKECLNKIGEIKEGLKQELPLDMLEIDLKNIWNILGEIIGETYSEELLDELFSKFCVGK